MSNLITEKCTKCETMEVVMEACAKHRKAALDLKEIAQGQKKKITYYKDLVAKMENDIDDLEVEIRERCQFATKVSKQRDDSEKEMKFLIEKVELKNEDIIRLEFALEKQKETFQKKVKQMVEENSILERELESALKDMKENETKAPMTVVEEEKGKMLKDINELVVDIDTLRLENNDKEVMLKEMSQENRVLHEEIKRLEELNENILNEKQDSLESESSEVQSLEDELSRSEKSFIYSGCFECKVCEANFTSREILKLHMKSHIKEMSIKMLEGHV